MIKMDNESAVKHALELAKTFCQAEGNTLEISKDGANFLADFIETLEDRLTGKTGDKQSS